MHKKTAIVPTPLFHYQINLANYEADVNQDYEKAISILEEIKSSKIREQSVYWGLANYSYKTKRQNKGYKYLKKYVEISGVSLDELFAFNFSIPKKDSLKIKNNYSRWHKNFMKNSDLSLYNQLMYYHHADQYFATQKILTDKKSQFHIREKIFQNNLTELRKTVFHNRGLPQASELGRYGSTPITLILLHHRRNDSIDQANYQFFEKSLRKEICEGNTYSPSLYARFVDNMEQVCSEDKPQLYGQFVDFRLKEKKTLPLKHPKEVDSLRKNIGLLPLDMFARKKMLYYQITTKNKMTFISLRRRWRRPAGRAGL